MLAGFLTACGRNAAGQRPTATAGGAATRGGRNIILATTTSTQDTGLLDVLIPTFEKRAGYKVKPIAVGTGEALKLGARGDADVLLVHAPQSEQEFMATGAGVDRTLVMHNDFVLVGPPSDPAGIRGMRSAARALGKIAKEEAAFVSRGDDSGTHKKELSLWEQTGTTKPRGSWYLETGTGMGQTLQVASEKRGYTLTDRGTYLARRDKLDLEVLVEGDKSLLNVYHAIAVNPKKFPKVNAAGARAWIDFLVSPDTQKLIGEFGRDRFGQPLFVPDAGKAEAAVGTR
jgi:tungstate transport system substrate-binding protein